MSVTEVFSNDGTGTVTSGGTTAPVSGTTESWTVNVTSGFPAAVANSTQFRVFDKQNPLEKILVTVSPGGTGVQTWSVVRGAENTTPVAHAPGFAISQVVTAGVFQAFAQGSGLPLSRLGDTLYEGSFGLAALPGNTSAQKLYYTQTGTGSASAAPGWAPITNGDVPQLSEYNPIGLTGAQSATSYAGGTVSGHPLYGSWSQGKWVLDQSGKMYVCVASGTPGTWRRVGAMPYQFFLDDYVKADGKQALVTVANGSAIVNSTPLAAPSAPVPTTATTGGSIPAGTYQVKVSYVNRWGETTASASGSITTTGTTSTITIPSPALSGNSTGWYAYVTQSGGNIYYRQQAAGSPSVLGVPLVLTTAPTISGANPPGADTSAAQIFSPVTTPAVPASGTPVSSTYTYPVNVTITGGTVTSVVISGIGQVGTGGGTYVLPPLASITLGYSAAPSWSWSSPDISKNVMICGALGSPGAPWIDTISAVNSPTQAVLSTAGAAVNQASCPMVFSSDDRLAADQCRSDAFAYGIANNNFCQVIATDRIYGLGANFFQQTAATGGVQYNTQFRIPLQNSSGATEQLEFQLLGPGDNAHCEFWESQLPNLGAATFVSYSLGPTSADPTYGQQSVIGGPTGNGGQIGGFANVTAVIKGIQVVQPGFSNSIGIDLTWVKGCVVRGSSKAYAPSTSNNGGVNPSSAWVSNSFFQSKLGTGLRLPATGNNDDMIVESFTSEGLTFGVISGADHAIVGRLATINCYIPFKLDFTVGLGGGPHDLTVGQWSNENCGAGLQVNGGGPCTVDIRMDGENSSLVYDVSDSGNALQGRLLWNDTFRTAGGIANVVAPIVTGAANLQIINDSLARSVQPAPTYTLGAAFQNPWWRNADVELAGGTVTAVKTGPTQTSLVTRSTTSGRFRLPTGWWLEIDGSFKPTTFNADLD